ncbi:MAG: hypothetical protein ACRDQB_06995, partial [Thermocrispum sp.]
MRLLRQEPRGLTAGFGGRIGVLDGMIHQQDVRRPLGLPRTIPPNGSCPRWTSPGSRRRSARSGGRAAC